MARYGSNRLMLALRIVGLLAVASTASGQAASDATDHDKTIPIWPGPDAVTSEFIPADPPLLFQGDGGTTMSVRGVDLWIVGRPSRVNRMLGTVAVKIAPLRRGQSAQLNNQQFNALIVDTVVKAATTAGASAAILDSVAKHSDGTSYCYYRLLAYLPEGAVPDSPIQKDWTPMDADGNKVPNGLATPISTLQFPDIQENNTKHLEGKAMASVCVGTDGKVISSTIVISSGFKELDAIALKALNIAKYSPATVGGRPISDCKVYRFTWKDH